MVSDDLRNVKWVIMGTSMMGHGHMQSLSTWRKWELKVRKWYRNRVENGPPLYKLERKALSAHLGEWGREHIFTPAASTCTVNNRL